MSEIAFCVWIKGPSEGSDPIKNFATCSYASIQPRAPVQTHTQNAIRGNSDVAIMSNHPFLPRRYPVGASDAAYTIRRHRNCLFACGFARFVRQASPFRATPFPPVLPQWAPALSVLAARRRSAYAGRAQAHHRNREEATSWHH